MCSYKTRNVVLLSCIKSLRELLVDSGESGRLHTCSIHLSSEGFATSLRLRTNALKEKLRTIPLKEKKIVFSLI